jgi:hypothetical protein
LFGEFGIEHFCGKFRIQGLGDAPDLEHEPAGYSAAYTPARALPS